MPTNRRRVNRRKRSIKDRLQGGAVVLRSLGRRVLPMSVLAVVAVGLPYLVFHAYLYVVSTPYFAVQTIEVRGLEHVAEAELLDRAQLHVGMNVFDVDVERVKALAEQEAWIEQARVERRLPDHVTLAVEEHEPAALLVDGETYVVLDRMGRPFKELSAEDPVDALLDLPLLTGLRREEAADPASTELILEAYDVVRLYADAGLDRLHPLSEVHLDPVMGLSLVPRNGLEIRLGRGQYEARLQRLRAVLASLEAEGRDVDYILVDQEEDLSRVTVGRHAEVGTDADGIARID